ncbi:MAG: YggT family protein [Actinomycetota bacterium]|nr:YggT family protein [Actinomycetota bacterium]
MKPVLCALVTAYIVVLIARVILSYFPVRSGSAIASVNLVLRDLTEPVLVPMRRVIPPAGPFDLSVMVLSIILFVLLQVLGC